MTPRRPREPRPTLPPTRSLGDAGAGFAGALLAGSQPRVLPVASFQKANRTPAFPAESTAAFRRPEGCRGSRFWDRATGSADGCRCPPSSPGLSPAAPAAPAAPMRVSGVSGAGCARPFVFGAAFLLPALCGCGGAGSFLPGRLRRPPSSGAHCRLILVVGCLPQRVVCSRPGVWGPPGKYRSSLGSE